MASGLGTATVGGAGGAGATDGFSVARTFVLTIGCGLSGGGCGDHGGLNGSGGYAGVSPQCSAGVEIPGPAKPEWLRLPHAAGTTGEAAAEGIVAEGDACAAGLEFGGHGESFQLGC